MGDSDLELEPYPNDFYREEEPGRAIQNAIFLCVVFLFFYLVELREGDRVAPL